MNVQIRPLRIEDAYISYLWRNDKDVFRFTGNIYNNEITLESELNWIKEVITRSDEYRCAIIVDNQYVGNVYLTQIDGLSANYHIFIGDKNFWGKRVAFIASQLIIDYAFNLLGLAKVCLKVNIQNISAIKLYYKLGFELLSIENDWQFMIKYKY